MNNYNLTAIKERSGQVFLETTFYRWPGLPVFASEEAIKNEIESGLDGNAGEIIKSGTIEFYWVDEKNNLTVLSKLLANNEDAPFLPEQYRKQVVNAKNRQQPCYFFIENGIRQNFRGSKEMRLRQSCEAEPHKKGYKYGYRLSIVLGMAVHKVILDGSLNIIDVIKSEKKLLQNAIFQ